MKSCYDNKGIINCMLVFPNTQTKYLEYINNLVSLLSTIVMVTFLFCIIIDA